MKSRERRVIVLKDLNSPNFEQAVFLLKEGREETSSAVYEAERIVEEYIFPAPVPPPRLKHQHRESNLDFLPFAVTAVIAVLAGAAAIVVNVI